MSLEREQNRNRGEGPYPDLEAIEAAGIRRLQELDRYRLEDHPEQLEKARNSWLQDLALAGLAPQLKSR